MTCDGNHALPRCHDAQCWHGPRKFGDAPFRAWWNGHIQKWFVMERHPQHKGTVVLDASLPTALNKCALDAALQHFYS